MQIVLADSSNYFITSLDSFNRTQEVRNVYRLENGELVLKYVPLTDDWSPERKREKASQVLSGRYITYCAFEGDRVVGQIMLLPELNKGRLVIDSYHVSSECRRQGIGRKLFAAAVEQAVKMGATALYASACSSEETINFYKAMGFTVSDNPIPECVEDEPLDIQMECRLT